MINFLGLSHFNPASFDDWLPWSWHERLSIGPAVPILGTHPLRSEPVTAWHIKPIGQHYHTREYRIKKAICDNDLRELSLALNSRRLLNGPVTRVEGMSPLALACKLDQQQIAKYLILRGANTDVKDMLGLTPLMHAVSRANFNCVETLVLNGANIEATDFFGLNAIDLARIKGYKSIVTYLEEKLKSPVPSHLPRFKLRFEFTSRAQSKFQYLNSMLYTPYAFPMVYPFNNLKGTYLLSLTNKVIPVNNA